MPKCTIDGREIEVPAGTTVINLTNDGTEFHEMALVKLAEGEERPLEELLAAGETLGLPRAESAAHVA